MLVRRRPSDPKVAAVLLAVSVVLNLAEGACRCGRDRNHHYRVASGSTAEARGGVRLALVWRYITTEMADAVEPLLDRQAAVLYRLLNPKR